MKIDQQNFREIYDTYFEPLCKFLNFYTRDVSVVEEVVQDVFLKLWEDREVLEIQYIKTFLYNAARNRMLNELRNSQNRNMLLEQWATQELERDSAEDCVDMEEFVSLLRERVDNLPTGCREIYVMSREEQMSYREIAERKGISVKTVEAQMGIALKRIREGMMAHYAQAMGRKDLLLLFLYYFV